MNIFKPNRLAILCGIARYGPPFGDLPAVSVDVTLLSKTLRKELHQDFRYDEVRVFSDEQLTLPRLVNILEDLQHDAPIGELLFYLAGHGCLRGKHAYYVTYGAELVRPGIRLDELAEALRAVSPSKTLAILDFCHAGALPASLSRLESVAVDGTDRLAVLAATRADERAVAGGVAEKSFTQHFIRALKEAPPDDKGIITWGSVGMFVCSAMVRSLNQRPIDRSDYLRIHPINRVKAPRAVAARSEKKVLPPERRQGTVVTLKIANYVTLSQRLDVEDLDKVLSSYHAACKSVIDDLEGQIVSQSSSELCTYFGYPKSHEDDAFRAVRCGLRILNELSMLNNDLRQTIKLLNQHPISLAISAHSGWVMLTDAGSNAYLPIGETLTYVDQLNSVARPGALTISADTYHQTKGGFTCLRLGPVSFEGTPTPQEIYEVNGEYICRNRFDLRRNIGLTRLVGRKLDLKRLLECWRNAKTEEGEVVQICGVAGIGKSRLLHDFKALISKDSYTLLECQCWEHKETTPFAPLLDLLEKVLNFRPGDSAEQRLQKLEEGLTKYEFDLTETVPLFAMLLSIPETGSYQFIRQKTAKQRRKTIESILALLFKVSEEKPLLVIVEDLHWVDPSTLELLGLLVRQAPSYRLLVVLSFRPEFKTSCLDQPSYIMPVNLRRLTSRQARLMVTRVAGNQSFPDHITEQIVATTGGVPLFIEEWTKAILESGVLEGESSALKKTEPPLALVMPATLHELLLVRLDKMGVAKEVAQLGAVIGLEFSHKLLSAISQLSLKALQGGLNSLLVAELLYVRGLPPNASYRFKHSLIKDAAYNALPRTKKVQLHRSIAQAITDNFPETVSTQPELLAHHYTAANLPDEAIAFWSLAGNRALNRFALAESIGHFNSAVNILETLPKSDSRDRCELEILLTLGTALSSKCYASPEVEKCYSRALALARGLCDLSQLFPVLRGLWCCYTGQGRFRPAQIIAEQLLVLATAEDDLSHLTEANRTVGVIHVWTGEFALARSYLEQGSALYSQQDIRSNALVYGIDPGAVCLIYTAWVLLFMGYPEQACRKRDEALTLVREISHPFTQAFMDTFTAWFSQFSRDCSGTHEMATKAVSRSVEFGFRQWLAYGHTLQGWALVKQGDERGLKLMQQGSAEALEYSAAHGLSAFLALQADAYAQLGQVNKSLIKLDEALAFTRSSGECFYEAELYRTKGLLLLVKAPDAMGEAENLFRKALEVARRQGARLFELRAATSLARLLHEQERSEEARELLEQSYAWFTEGFDTPDLIDSRELIRRLY